MPERLNGTVLKTVRGETSSGVRISLSPPAPKTTRLGLFLFVRSREREIRKTLAGAPLGRRVGVARVRLFYERSDLKYPRE